MFAQSAKEYPHATRDRDSILPISKVLDLPINLDFGEFDDYRRFGQAVRAAARGDDHHHEHDDEFCPNGVRAVLVMWEHCCIPGVLRALGCKDDRCSRCWSTANYNTVVRLELPVENNENERNGDFAELRWLDSPNSSGQAFASWAGGIPDDYRCADERHVCQKLLNSRDRWWGLEYHSWGTQRCRFPNGTFVPAINCSKHF